MKIKKAMPVTKKAKSKKQTAAPKVKKKTGPVAKKTAVKKKAVPPKIKPAPVWGPPQTINEIFTPGIIGHAAATPQDDLNYLVVDDYLVDSSGISHGGESVDPLKQISLNGVNKIVITVRPEAGKSLFTVTRPAGITKGNLYINFARRAMHPASGGTTYNSYTPAITFTNLVGTAPLITYTLFFINKLNNNFFELYIEGEFTADFSFTEMVVTCTFPVRNLMPVVDFFRLSSSNIPFTLRGAANPNYIRFSYHPPALTDLGPMVTLS